MMNCCYLMTTAKSDVPSCVDLRAGGWLLLLLAQITKR
jgi:hypothetical protein